MTQAYSDPKRASEPRSYRAIVSATRGRLLGGGIVHESSRMETPKMAEDWAQAILEGNASVGVIATFHVRPDTRAPEIMAEALADAQEGGQE